jgi:DNA-directed RNA polymerase subunit omega
MFEVDTKVGSKYRFIILAAQRARQLMAGAQQRVDSKFQKPACVAIEELKEGKLKWTKSEVKPPVPSNEVGELLLDTTS